MNGPTIGDIMAELQASVLTSPPEGFAEASTFLQGNKIHHSRDSLNRFFNQHDVEKKIFYSNGREKTAWNIEQALAVYKKKLGQE